MDWLLWPIAGFWFVVFIDAAIGLNKIPDIAAHTWLSSNDRLSIIVAARDEASSIEKSLLSQFRQTHRNVEWIVVNDRSTDYTGEILNRLAHVEPRLRVLHIDELPSGWLGKNYALYKGYEHSSGDYLLFTDADILFSEDAFARTLSFLKENHVSHLTLAPSMHVNGFWLQSFIAFFLFSFSFFKRPWATNNANSKQAIGIGAFNMLTREAYEQAGTHAALKNRPDDDLQLGLRIKYADRKQLFATALPFISVEWYESLGDAIRGLEKNTFAGLHYSIGLTLFSIIGLFVSHVLPFIAIWSNSIPAAISIMFMLIMYVLITRRMTTFGWRHFIAFPFTTCLFIYTIFRSVFLTLKKGGIVWRGTFYPLDILKKDRK